MTSPRRASLSSAIRDFLCRCERVCVRVIETPGAPRTGTTAAGASEGHERMTIAYSDDETAWQSAAASSAKFAARVLYMGHEMVAWTVSSSSSEEGKEDDAGVKSAAISASDVRIDAGAAADDEGGLLPLVRGLDAALKKEQTQKDAKAAAAAFINTHASTNPSMTVDLCSRAGVELSPWTRLFYAKLLEARTTTMMSHPASAAATTAAMMPALGADDIHGFRARTSDLTGMLALLDGIRLLDRASLSPPEGEGEEAAAVSLALLDAAIGCYTEAAAAAAAAAAATSPSVGPRAALAASLELDDIADPAVMLAKARQSRLELLSRGALARLRAWLAAHGAQQYPARAAAAGDRCPPLCLSRVDLSLLHAGESGATLIGQAVASDPNQRCIDLQGCSLADDAATALATAMFPPTEPFPRHCLRVVVLCNNRIGPDGAAALGRALLVGSSPASSSSSSKPRLLERLDLSSNCLGDEGTTAFFSFGGHGAATSSAAPASTQVLALDLGRNRIGEQGAAALYRAAATAPGGSPGRMGPLASLTVLSLAHNNLVSARALEGRLPSSLTSLELSGNKFGPAGADALAAGLADLPGLTSLGMSNCALGSKGGVRGESIFIRALARHPALHRLSLRMNSLRADGIRALAVIIDPRTGCSSLSQLELAGNDACSRGEDPGAVRALSDALVARAAAAISAEVPARGAPQPLTSLDLSFNGLSGGESACDAGLMALRGCMSSGGGLTRLLLDSNDIGPNGLEAISSALCTQVGGRLVPVEETTEHEVEEQVEVVRGPPEAAGGAGAAASQGGAAAKKSWFGAGFSRSKPVARPAEPQVDVITTTRTVRTTRVTGFCFEEGPTAAPSSLATASPDGALGALCHLSLATNALCR